MLRSSSLLKRASEKIVTHLMTVYPPDGDTPTPIPWPPLANMLLDETGQETTRNLLMMAAKANCLPKGTLDSKYKIIYAFFFKTSKILGSTANLL